MSKENEYQINEQRDNYSITNHHGSPKPQARPFPRWRWEAAKWDKNKKQAGFYKTILKRSPRSLHHQSSDYRVTGGGGGVGNKMNSTDKTLVWKLFLKGPITMKTSVQPPPSTNWGQYFEATATCLRGEGFTKQSDMVNPIFTISLYFLTIYTFFPNPLLFLYRYNALSQLMLISCDLWSFLVTSQQISLLMLIIRREDKGP